MENMRTALSIKLKNCHGIRELDHTFDFSRNNTAAIYAPNGTMKTSLARTIRDYSRKQESSDQMFPDRPCERQIKDQNGTDLPSEDIVVVLSYDEELGPTEATSTLLINAELRREYESLQVELRDSGNNLVKELKATAQTKQDPAFLIAKIFSNDPNAFFAALVRVSDELAAQSDAPFADIPFDIIFNEKIRGLLEKAEFKEALKSYVTRLNELLDESQYFSRESFSYYNAGQITKSLDSNGFFSAKHGLILRDTDGNELPVNDSKALKTIVEEERKKITEDAQLRKKLEIIGSELERNEDARKFYAFLSSRMEVLSEFENPKLFEEKIWKSYLKTHYELYKGVVDKYKNTEQRRREIESEATNERTQWERVIEIFNERFYVPFRLTAKNREKVVLGVEPVLELGFEFEDGKDRAKVERSALLRVLSQGEKKAFYILNVLFEVETRKGNRRNTLFVIDDIADSFDYKNKYAIIQYLKDMRDQETFQLLVLTHNFDFFRTIESRSVASYNDCWMAQRTDSKVELIPASYVKNPFMEFKKHLATDLTKRLAVIPFVRNLIEYSRGDSDPEFIKLTSLLHRKAETKTITHGDLDQIFNNNFGQAIAWPTQDALVVDTIISEADNLLLSPDAANLANKIVLSIAIRLQAEKYMIGTIKDDGFIASITGNQTSKLYDKLKTCGNATEQGLKVVDSVILMTPENIHLNAFMYEPIVDLSDAHLRKLYTEVKLLLS
jgi:energy-coupling factor transporter ATP-binding protein EcfA2